MSATAAASPSVARDAAVEARVAELLGAIRSVTGPGTVPLHAPSIGAAESAAVQACLDSTFVSSVGAWVERFERDLAAITGARHVVAVTSGTAALHAALVCAGVRPGDEVLVPSLTFAATAAAVVHAGAVPHFVDVAPATGALDADALADHLRAVTERRDGACVHRATGRVVRALVPMHLFGHVADMPALLAVAAAFGLVVVEDAAEALGSTRDGRHAGTWGRAGILSFNGNKIVTTGGGGAILTDDEALARRARHLTTTARIAHPWDVAHDAVGWNYRLPNLNAALGCAQLARLEGFLAAKRVLHARYAEALAPVAGVRLLGEPAGARSNHWLQAIVLDDDACALREPLLDAAVAEGLQLRPVWTPLHRLAPYRDCPAMPLPVTESLAVRLVNLPSSAALVPGAGA